METGYIFGRPIGVGRGMLAALFTLCVTHVSLGAGAEPASKGTATATQGAEQEREAAKLYKAAQSAFAAGRMIEAKALLERALDMRPNPSVVGVLGQVEFELGEFPKAAAHLAESLRRTEHPVGVKRKMEDLLARAQKKVGTVVVTVVPEDARVLVDGSEWSLDATGSQIFVLPGTHAIDIERDGYAPALEQVEAKAGSAHRLDFELTKKPEPPPIEVKPDPPAPLPPPPPPAEPPPPPSKLVPTIVLIAGSAVTASLLGVGIYYHLGGADRADEADRIGRTLGACDLPLTGDCARLHRVIDQRDSKYLTAKVLYGVSAGVAVATGVATYLLWPKRKAPPPVAVWVGSDMLGVAGDF